MKWSRGLCWLGSQGFMADIKNEKDRNLSRPATLMHVFVLRNQSERYLKDGTDDTRIDLISRE